jgi:hypothetical protein
MPERVESYSGGAYAEDPVKFFWEGDWRIVSRVVARRRLPEEKQFVVEDEKREVFVLTYDVSSGEWSIRPGT